MITTESLITFTEEVLLYTGVVYYLYNFAYYVYIKGKMKKFIDASDMVIFIMCVLLFIGICRGVQGRNASVFFWFFGFMHFTEIVLVTLLESVNVLMEERKNNKGTKNNVGDG